jgi:hypothetical protein
MLGWKLGDGLLICVDFFREVKALNSSECPIRSFSFYRNVSDEVLILSYSRSKALSLRPVMNSPASLFQKGW